MSSRLDVAHKTFRVYHYDKPEPHVMFVIENEDIEIKFTPHKFRVFARWLAGEGETSMYTHPPEDLE